MIINSVKTGTATGTGYINNKTGLYDRQIKVNWGYCTTISGGT